MELSERKVKILNAIIQTYLNTGEPVGSRTISKFTDLNLSSATIRNEMADLEELGYINGWIGKDEVMETYEIMKKNQYGQYLKDVLDGKYLD